jgi:ABC-type sugar transport system permease subunit
MRAARTKTIVPYLYILPAMLFIALIILLPAVSILFSGFLTSRAQQQVWHGLGNYVMIFKDDLFWISIVNNLRLFLSVPVMTVISVLIAAILFEKITGWNLYQSIIFTPYILAIPVVGIVFSYLLQYRGVVNTLLAAVGLKWAVSDWLGSPKLAIWSMIAVVIWKQFGFGVVLFLARLSSVSLSLFEAAIIDGASWWQRLVNVTIPQLAMVIEFYITVNLINMLSWVFDFVFVMTGGGPVNSTYVLEYYIYQKTFISSLDYLGAAGGVIVLIVAALLIALESSLRKRLEQLE